MNSNYDFTGQVALVTGAAKGMGLATARMFAESRASVVLADLDGALAGTGGRAHHGRGRQGGRPALRRGRRGAGRSRGGSCRCAVRPAGHGLQQRRHPGPAQRRRRRADRALRADGRRQPARGLGVHEARAARHAAAGLGRDRQLLVARRPGRPAGTRRLPRHQARRGRHDPERRRRVCPARHPHQRRLPGDDRHTHGGRHARRPVRRDGGDHEA